MASNTRHFDTGYYEDPRTGDRIREYGVRHVPVNDVRGDELATIPYNRGQADAAATAARSELSVQNLQRYNDRMSNHRVSREHYNERGDYDYDDRSSPPRRRRRSSSRSSAESSPPRRRRSTSRRRSRSRSRSRDRRAHSLSDDGHGRRKSDWDRNAEEFFNKNFDRSSNGAIAAAAGAGLGYWATKKFGGGGDPHRPRDKNNWRSIGGGVAGAALGNAVEKHWSERERRRRSGSR